VARGEVMHCTQHGSARATCGQEGKRVIMAQTGHRSADMVRRYIRDWNLWRENAAMLVGL